MSRENTHTIGRGKEDRLHVGSVPVWPGRSATLDNPHAILTVLSEAKTEPLQLYEAERRLADDTQQGGCWCISADQFQLQQVGEVMHPSDATDGVLMREVPMASAGETAMRVQFTDYEAAVIFVTAAIKYGIDYAPSDQLARERPQCPWLEPIISRHGSLDTVEAKWGDFRSALLPRLRRKRGVSKQVERIVRDLGWLLTD